MGGTSSKPQVFDKYNYVATNEVHEDDPIFNSLLSSNLVCSEVSDNEFYSMIHPETIRIIRDCNNAVFRLLFKKTIEEIPSAINMRAFDKLAHLCRVLTRLFPVINESKAEVKYFWFDTDLAAQAIDLLKGLFNLRGFTSPSSSEFPLIWERGLARKAKNEGIFKSDTYRFRNIVVDLALSSITIDLYQPEQPTPPHYWSSTPLIFCSILNTAIMDTKWSSADLVKSLKPKCLSLLLMTTPINESNLFSKVSQHSDSQFLLSQVSTLLIATKSDQYLILLWILVSCLPQLTNCDLRPALFTYLTDPGNQSLLKDLVLFTISYRTLKYAEYMKYLLDTPLTTLDVRTAVKLDTLWNCIPLFSQADLASTSWSRTVSTCTDEFKPIIHKINDRASSKATDLQVFHWTPERVLWLKKQNAALSFEFNKHIWPQSTIKLVQLEEPDNSYTKKVKSWIGFT